MSSPPTGEVTFLFTDIEGSTRLWERDAKRMQRALARHDEIIKGVITSHGGFVFKAVGDAFCSAFASAPDALTAALYVQRAVSEEPWDEHCKVRVRMALHTGQTEEIDGDYFGPPLNRIARLLSAGHGGQTLLSRATQELVRDELPSGTNLRDLGERRLKDLLKPERIFQLIAPDLPSSFPPLKTLDTRLNNLPAQPTPLIGRKREVAEVCALLRRKDVRLLTLTGAGGTGKSRLGLQSATELIDEFEDGVFFVSLAPITKPELVISTIAGPLGIVEGSQQSLEEALTAHLREKELLLLLDNFEHVLGAVPLVGELLSSCTRLKILATSRAALRAYGEREYAVPPLALPDPKRLPPLERLGRYEAVRLFVERAEAVSRFALNHENAAAIAEICARLDGLPLAIELAAARIKLLPPKAMLERLDSRLKLLRGGAHDLPARQQTLRDAIKWSFDLLNEGESALMARMAVFVGGRTLEAIEAICDAEGDLPMDTLEGISSLLDNSLLRQEEGPGGEPRFVMLETIHEYARERLGESGEEEVIGRAHAQYYLRLVEQAEPNLKGSSRQADWLARLEAEHDNMRAALAWSLQVGETQMTLRLAGALRYFWFMRGYLSEGRRWLRAALAASAGRPDTAVAKALVGVGAIALSQGDYQEAESALEKGVALHREFGDARDLAGALNNLGNVALHQGRYEEATPFYEESLALWREAGEKYGVEGPLGNLGNLALYRGDYERARLLYEESLQLAREVEDKQGAALALGNLGAVAIHQQNYGRAIDLQAEGLALVQELGDMEGVAFGLEMMATAAAAQGQIRRAARLWGAAEVLRESIGAPLPANERPDYNRQVTAAGSQLEEAAWLEAWTKGQAMTPEEAVVYALDEV